MDLPSFPTLTWWQLAQAASAALLVVAVLIGLIRRDTRSKRVTAIAVVIGLAWSAQGMWDTAVNHYDVPEQLAAVIFVLFEAFMLSSMLDAERFRADHPRRARPVRFVWTLAIIMGAVVALAEGWAQAPLRFAVPILVAWRWYLSLTADDDPEQREPSSWRWTPSRLGLKLGLLEPGRKNATTISRDQLIARITALHFAERWGSPALGTLTNRRLRLARLTLDADDDALTESAARIARAAAVMGDKPQEQPQEQPPATPEPTPEVHPVMPPQPVEPITVRPIRIPEPEQQPQGWHRTPDGLVLRGQDLVDDAVRRFTPGMTNAQIAALYAPELKQRTAEKIGAEARRTKVNGTR